VGAKVVTSVFAGKKNIVQN